jgi:hypothetical protein
MSVPAGTKRVPISSSSVMQGYARVTLATDIGTGGSV